MSDYGQIQHELIAAVKDLALELERVPTKTEILTRVPAAQYRIAKYFGNYSVLLAAAGLESYAERRKGPTRQEIQTILHQDVSEVVAQHAPAPRQITLPKDFETILVIGDCHFPFVNKDALKQVYEFAAETQPAHIVQMGDLYDLYAHSRFPRSLNTYSPDKEIELARFGAQEMWDTLAKVSPRSKRHLLTGNHDIRPLKKILMAAPELESIVRRGIEPYFQFENVATVTDPRTEYDIQGIKFLHGYLTQAGAHRDFLQANTVSAHTHRGSVTYRPLANRILWELNAGFVGDETAKALSYTAQRTTGWTVGFGYIDRHGPRFISL